ncbi:MAG: polysaccharide biosynthesis/export family protein [Planctomycetes bacterium]|nr:polysaccharide biosynthesis/export family protein [Planctomycetota bacterium]
MGTAVLAAGCQGREPLHPEFRRPAEPPLPFTAGDALKEFDAVPEKEYRLGEGDAVTVQVWDRPDLSGPQIVGPDGAITLPVAGTLRVAGMTRDEAAKAIKESLSRFYANLTVTVRVDRYVSNRVVVLGRVNAPGVLQFDTPPTLLEALARAGGLAAEPNHNLTHCAVVRGRERVAWIDLRRLMEDADLAFNLRLKPDDLVFVPDRGDTPVYVLGEVQKPGLFRWTSDMSLLDALALAGGTTRDAAPSSMYLIRPSLGIQSQISLDEVMAVGNQGLRLQKGDILYVPTNGLADIGYVLEKLNLYGWLFVGATVRSSIVR